MLKLNASEGVGGGGGGEEEGGRGEGELHFQDEDEDETDGDFFRKELPQHACKYEFFCLKEVNEVVMFDVSVFLQSLWGLIPSK